MQKRQSGLVLLAFMMLGFIAWPMESVQADEASQAPLGEHTKVSGTVTSVKSSTVFVKTSWGRLSFSAGAAPANIKVGEDVVMTMSDDNIVIDVHRKGD